MTKRRDKCEPDVELLVLHQNDLECCSAKSFRDSGSFFHQSNGPFGTFLP